MASKKPKGWTDNPLGELQKLYNVFQPNYTDPQSLAQFKETAKQVGSTGIQGADLYTTGGLGLSFAQNVIRPSATIASKETRTTKASKGMTQFAKDAAITAASAGAGYVAGKAIQAGVNKAAPSVAKLLAKTNLSSELAPGQSLALHFSDNPNLKTIKDIPELRNKGGNFGSDFDSTLISPPGATYGYGPIGKKSSYTEVQGAIQEANTSKVRALMQGEKREYTLYATKADPLVKGRVERIKDPEYGSSKLAGDQGQSIYGKQKVIAKTKLNYDAYEAALAKERALGKTASPYGNNVEYEAAKQATIQVSQQNVDETYNFFATNKKVLRAGLEPHSLQNPASAYYYGTPAIPRASTPPIPTVTQTIQNMVKGAPKTGAAAGVVAANNKKVSKKK